MSEPSFHMTPDEFRRHGHRASSSGSPGTWRRSRTSRSCRRSQPGDVRAALPAHPPQHAEPFERRPGRPRPGDPAGDHPLAVAQLVRLLPGQQLRPVDPRRAPVRRARRPGDALVDQPRLHRAGDARPRLDGRAARPARPVPVRRRPGAGSSRTAPRRPRSCALLAARQRAVDAGARPGRPRRLRLGPHPLVAWRRPPASPGWIRASSAWWPSTTDFAMRPDALAAAIAEDRGGRPDAVLLLRHGGDDVVAGRRPGRRLADVCAAGRRLAARRRGDGRRRPPCARSCGG